MGMEWGCCCITAQMPFSWGQLSTREGEDRVGRASPPCLSRDVADLPSESPLQPPVPSSPQRPYTGGQRRGSAGGWEASLRFPAGVGKDAPRWRGHRGSVIPAPHCWGRGQRPPLPQPARPVPTPCGGPGHCPRRPSQWKPPVFSICTVFPLIFFSLLYFSMRCLQ